jgi:hypothetical protein
MFEHHPVRLNVMGEYYCDIDANTETETETEIAVDKIPYLVV